MCDIPGYEENYVVTRNGEVFNKKTGRELKRYIDRSGYLVAHLCTSGREDHIKIHRLLALCFIPNPYNREMVDHIDRNRLNNNIENLRWVTRSQNGTNARKRSDNISGHRGIYYDTQNNKWCAKITKNNKNTKKHFEYSDKGLREAVEWRRQMEDKLHTYD